MVRSGARSRVLLVLPPDLDAPPPIRANRFPPQGPAIVAASLRLDAVVVRAVDLELDVYERPLSIGGHVLDEERLLPFLAGRKDEELEAFATELLDRLGDVEVDAVGFSIDRHTQIDVTLLLGVAAKRRFGVPVVVGGVNGRAALDRLTAYGVRGIDFATSAFTPDEIRAVFRSVLAADPRRDELAVDPLGASIATEPDGYPTPDFSIYDLARYRRDAFVPWAREGGVRYEGGGDRLLVLPYHFTFDCQYACAFCQRDGVQTTKAMDRVVRDLAMLSEQHECRDFMLFDAQINLLAAPFSQALLDARLDLHWTDSYRVAPRRPKDALELMARAGCVGLTFGVETVSDRMLTKMIKGHTRAKASAIVRDAHALEMFVRVNLLPCFPGETRADHETTVAWVKEHAAQIDDLAPSAFYLAEGSPVGRAPERFGIVIRGSRELHGDHKFRKNLGSLAYDEVDGLRWEEREATLRPAEEELREAWRSGRRGRAEVGGSAQAFALRRAFSTKREAYEWVGRLRGEPFSEVDGEQRPMEITEDLEGNVPVPTGSLRAAAADAVARLLAKTGLTVCPPKDENGRLTLELRDAEGRSVRVIVAPFREGAKYLRRGQRLMVWFNADAKEPPWTKLVTTKVAELLCLPSFENLRSELGRRLVVVRPDAGALPAAHRRWTVIDLVRAGLKPAAAVLVASPDEALAGVADLPARVLSTVAFAHDARDNLVQGGETSGQRSLYVGHVQRDVERLRVIDERLYARAHGDAARAELHLEMGRLLGFPRCCALAFAESDRQGSPHGDYYASVLRLGWDYVPIDFRYNHVVARQYHLPFLIHEPCRSSCSATRDLVEVTISRLYADGSRWIIESVLSQGAVLWPDDRLALFRPTGQLDADGAVAVTDFNVDAHPEVRGGPIERGIGRDSAGFRDAAVDALRTRGGQLEVRVDGAFRPFVRAAGSPVVVTPRPVAAPPVVERAARPTSERQPGPPRLIGD